MSIITESPTRTYVAICFFKKYYFRKFILPEEYINNSEMAAWYFLNRIDVFSAIEHVITFEDYSNLVEVAETR